MGWGSREAQSRRNQRFFFFFFKKETDRIAWEVPGSTFPGEKGGQDEAGTFFWRVCSLTQGWVSHPPPPSCPPGPRLPSRGAPPLELTAPPPAKWLPWRDWGGGVSSGPGELWLPFCKPVISSCFHFGTLDRCAPRPTRS